MNKLNTVLTELGVSKVRLAKYLGVSRQMLYNYLALDNLEDWPKEKAVKLLGLLNIKDSNELNDLEIDGDYIIHVESRLNEGVKDSVNKEVLADLKGFNTAITELISNITAIYLSILISDSSLCFFITLSE